MVVLEQGSWGKYGREHEYNKDEWIHRHLAEVRQRAKIVVLSANASESARLLLLSKSARFPEPMRAVWSANT